MSLPPPPLIVSAPPPPLRTLAAPLPVRALARPLPVPLIAAVAGQDEVLDIGGERKVTELLTLSVPPPAASMTAVERIVDEIGVVAEAARHRVGAGAAVELVGA